MTYRLIELFSTFVNQYLNEHGDKQWQWLEMDVNQPHVSNRQETEASKRERERYKLVSVSLLLTNTRGPSSVQIVEYLCSCLIEYLCSWFKHSARTNEGGRERAPPPAVPPPAGAAEGKSIFVDPLIVFPMSSAARLIQICFRFFGKHSH